MSNTRVQSPIFQKNCGNFTNSVTKHKAFAFQLQIVHIMYNLFYKSHIEICFGKHIEK